MRNPYLDDLRRLLKLALVLIPRDELAQALRRLADRVET